MYSYFDDDNNLTTNDNVETVRQMWQESLLVRNLQYLLSVSAAPLTV